MQNRSIEGSESRGVASIGLQITSEIPKWKYCKLAGGKFPGKKRIAVIRLHAA